MAPGPRFWVQAGAAVGNSERCQRFCSGQSDDSMGGGSASCPPSAAFEDSRFPKNRIAEGALSGFRDIAPKLVPE